jgi:hypothetical protein
VCDQWPRPSGYRKCSGAPPSSSNLGKGTTLRKIVLGRRAEHRAGISRMTGPGSTFAGTDVIHRVRVSFGATDVESVRVITSGS